MEKAAAAREADRQVSRPRARSQARREPHLLSMPADGASSCVASASAESAQRTCHSTFLVIHPLGVRAPHSSVIRPCNLRGRHRIGVFATDGSELPWRVTCALCEDTGWKTITIDGVSRVTRCECWQQRLSQSLIKSARIPRGYSHCELSNFEIHTDTQRAAHRKAMRLVDQFPVFEKGLLFYGDTGVGKTHLAVALMREAILKKNARAIFYETRELLKLVRDTYSGSTELSELDVLRPVLET